MAVFRASVVCSSDFTHALVIATSVATFSFVNNATNAHYPVPFDYVCTQDGAAAQAVRRGAASCLRCEATEAALHNRAGGDAAAAAKVGDGPGAAAGMWKLRSVLAISI